MAARVVELPSGRELYAENADKPFTPASNMKLVVTAAALDLFGPDHTFDTYLVQLGDDICIVGNGDPATGDPRLARRDDRRVSTLLHEWAALLAEKGLHHIAGDLCYDPTFFEMIQLHPNWDTEDLDEWYACPVSGLNFNDNCIDVFVRPEADGEAVQFRVVPATDSVSILNMCLSGLGAKGKRANLTRLGQCNIYALTGTTDRRRSLKSKPVIRPGLLFADAFRVAAAQHGITWGGTIRAVQVERDAAGRPNQGEILAVHKTPIADVLWRTNTHSQNLFAECLAKQIGRRWALAHGRNEPGSWSDARKAIPAQLRKLGVPTWGLRVDDGSGLSDRNRVTARLLTDLLAATYNHPHGDVFRASLSTVGEQGTLQSRMKDLKGHVFAKTGYIGGVRTLSGYVRTYHGTWLAFSFLYNRIPGPVEPYEQLQDNACRILANWNPAPPDK